MKVASFAGIVFQVKEKKMLSFQDANLKESSGYEQHDRIRKRPFLEYSGEELKTFTITVYADARWGVRPRGVQKKLRKVRQSHKPHNFLLDGKRVTDNYLVLQEVDADYVAFWRNGEPEVMKFNLTFTECPVKNKKKKAGKNNAKKTGGKKTKSGKAGQKTSVSKKSTTIYTIKKGDTYWGLAEKYYGSGTKYKKIMNANPRYPNPKKLPIGGKLKIPK